MQYPMQPYAVLTQHIYVSAYGHYVSGRCIYYWAVSIREPHPPLTRILPPSITDSLQRICISGASPANISSTED